MHKDMAEGRGRRSKRDNKKMNVEGEKEGGSNRERIKQKVEKARENFGGNGGIWHQGEVKSRIGNCEGKRQYRGAGAKRLSQFL
ncbi:Hypothetical protein SMAX5B_001361 [Scophthalmus maximus]|uniref:Uncharacterized protein n=1 Tax=Scophthalmus maximus TaxID=52904 RepID=A0A2U9BAI3_SCOMX|nr:Hypothetical protein SMAX5B_001361 [Scophthalmus maximus]